MAMEYLVKKPALPQFIASLERIATRETYPQIRNEIVYFDDEAHRPPFEQTVRARRHTNAVPPWRFQPSQTEIWMLEQKSETEPGVLKQMQRIALRFSEIIALLGDQTESKGAQLSALVPFMANSYERQNFIVKGDGRIRITVDNKAVYYAFVNGLVAERTGSKEFSRVELKTYGHGAHNDYLLQVYGALGLAKAVPVISKKDMAYNLHRQRLMNESGWHPGRTDTEIEAKLSLDASHQHLFNLIKEDFATGRVKGFTRLERFPHTIVGGKISIYLITNTNEYLRMSRRGDDSVFTKKEDSKIMDDPYGLKCIVKRRELEGALISVPEIKDELTLYKKEKYFMVRGKHGNYRVSIDRCSRVNGYRGDLYQMEIESTMMRPSKEQEAVAAREIADITWQLIRMHSELKPTTLTKLEWIMGLGRQ